MGECEDTVEGCWTTVMVGYLDMDNTNLRRMQIARPPCYACAGHSFNGPKGKIVLDAHARALIENSE